jgi:NitT/TauT family transport system substrate-binding protein
MKNIWYCIIIYAFVLVSCGQSYEEKQRLSRAEITKLRIEDSLSLKIAVMPTMDCLPIFLAKDNHLFDTLNVDVHLLKLNAQMDCDTAIIHGRVEGSITDLVRAERMQRKGIALRYVSATNTYWQLISNRMARIKELKQLSDKMIAMTRYSATDYLTNLALDSAKPKYDVFRIQVNDVNIRLRMLLNNEMDAMLLTEPQATTARLYKNPVLMDSRDKRIRFGVLAFREKALKDKRRQAQLKLFIQAYNMACDSLNTNGLQHYSNLIMKYCGADRKTIKALPKMKFEHALPPRKSDILKAKKG